MVKSVRLRIEKKLWLQETFKKKWELLFFATNIGEPLQIALFDQHIITVIQEHDVQFADLDRILVGCVWFSIWVTIAA